MSNAITPAPAKQLATRRSLARNALANPADAERHLKAILSALPEWVREGDLADTPEWVSERKDPAAPVTGWTLFDEAEDHAQPAEAAQ